MSGFTTFAWVLGLTGALLVSFNLLMRWASRRGIGRDAGGLVPEGAEQGLVYFFSPTCGPCRAMTPVIRALSAEDPRVRAVDVSREPEVALRYGVLGTPTVVVVREGKVADVLVGARSEAQLRALLP